MSDDKYSYMVPKGIKEEMDVSIIGNKILFTLDDESLEGLTATLDKGNDIVTLEFSAHNNCSLQYTMMMSLDKKEIQLLIKALSYVESHMVCMD